MVTNNFFLPPSDSATCSACSLQTPPKPYSTLFSVIAPCRIPYLGNNSITCRRLFRRFSTHPDPQTTPRGSDSFRTSELSTCHLRAGPTDSEISSGFLVACLLSVESFSRSNSLFNSALVTADDIDGARVQRCLHRLALHSANIIDFVDFTRRTIMYTTPLDTRAGTDFRSLAEDVVLRILLFSDIDTLFTCKQVSRPLQRLIDTDIYLQYKIELALNGMVDGPAGCSMNIVEKLQLLRDYTTQYRNTQFAASGFKHSWQRYPQDVTMPTTDWEALLGFGGSIAYIVTKPPQKQISVCAPPPFSGPRKMQDWVVPYEALSGHRDLVVVSVSVDLSQNLLLVAVQGEDTRHLSILLRSLDGPKEAHPHALQPTLAVTASDEVRSVGDDTPNGSILRADSIQIHGNIVAWKLSVESDPPIPCDIEVWDWRIGHRLWRSHYASDTSFTLLDDAHIVTAGPERGELVVEAFAQGTRGEETGPVLALGLPPQRESVRIQESSIPSPRSPTEPFWTDPALRMVVVKLTDESALLIPFKTFLGQISAAQTRDQATPKRIEPPQLTWEDWRAHTFPLVAPETKYPMWSFKHCHSYGSRVVVNGYKHLAVMFDLNPWAARNARRFPEPSRRSDDDKTPKDLFNTRDVAFPHGVVLDEWYRGMGLGQSTPGLATDPMGFTEVYSMGLPSHRFLGSITHYV